MFVNENNGKMYAEANRVEKLRFLSTMRTVVEFVVDIESAEKNGMIPLAQFNKYCPSADEIERLKSLPPEDYPDRFDARFGMSLLWFGEIMVLCAKVNRKSFFEDAAKWLSK